MIHFYILFGNFEFCLLNISIYTFINFYTLLLYITDVYIFFYILLFLMTSVISTKLAVRKGIGKV